MTEPSTTRVEAFIAAHGLDAQVISTPAGVPTVEAAATALNVAADQIIKTLVFANADGQLVIAIACGTGRVDRNRLAQAAATGKLTFASADVVLATTGYPPGGVAPIGLPVEAIVIVDEQVMNQPIVYGGSGTDLHMIRIRPCDIVRLNDASIAPILQSDGP